MGNNSAKVSSKCSILTRDEDPIVSNSFRIISKNADRIKEDDLMKYWGSQMDPRLAQYITNYLFGPLGQRSSAVDFQHFAELYVYCVRGSPDERVSVLLSSLGHADTDTDIDYPLIKEYVEAVVSSYIRTMRLQAGNEYKSWENSGFRIVKDSVQKLAEGLVYDVVKQGTQKVAREDAEKWLQQNATFLRMLQEIFHHLYRYKMTNSSSGEIARSLDASTKSKLLPICEGLPDVPNFSAFTDISQILYINSNLPTEFQKKWRFLFSSQIHGESFSTFLGRIVDQGPSVIIVEDTDDCVYGGFAPDSWNLSPNFLGNESAFLFTLRPKMRCFPTSGYNDHYQYLNLHQQTMPNGLGMGGQFNYWGLWLDSDYGNGECSETCTTFKNYVQLSVNKKFTIRHLEVWGVGKKPVKGEEDGETELRSVLDGNSEERAILEIAGRRMYSEGLKEEPNT